MKKLISLTLVAVMLLTMLAACGEEPSDLQTLATPGNVTISDTGLITWDAVEHATSYQVTVGSNTYTASTNSYQVTNLNVDFTYSVVAKADGYRDSVPSAAKTYQASRIPPVEVPDVAVAIKGNSEVRAGHSITLKAEVTGTTDTAVLWSVTRGNEFAVIDPISGVLTAVSGVSGDQIVEVTARSLADESAVGTRAITVVSQPILTQAMLDKIASQDTIAFEGYLTVSLYNFGLYDTLYKTSNTNLKTSMDGTNWYTQYEDGNTGTLASLYYQNHDGNACQVGVSFMNEEEYAPMLDDNGNAVAWQDAGLYNCFGGLTVDDFSFNEQTWRYEYVGDDDTLMARMVASANPYDFVPIKLALILEEGEIMGIYSLAADDYTIVGGYRAVQELTVALNYGSTVEVPTIGKFKHDDMHDPLAEAIANMRNLTNYKTDYTQIVATVYASGYTMEGYTETIVPGDCYYEPFEMSYDSLGEEIRNYSGDVYGYHKISDVLYNAYCTGEGGYEATRAYTADFSGAKPSFAFAAEIFTSYYVDEEEETVTYYVDDVMSSVASTFYYGVGNEIALYGLFATRGYTSLSESFTPYVTVKDGYIVEAGFYFYLGSVYGVVELTYSDFGTAALPDGVAIDFTPRQVPASWDELTIIVSQEDSDLEEDVPVNAKTYLTEFFGDETVAASVPFFGAVLGDTYGFGLTTYHMPGGSTTAKASVVLYYDVPLDRDYTINSYLDTLGAYLISLGFEKNAYDEYSDGTIVVAPIDSSLDLTIYVWKA